MQANRQTSHAEANHRVGTLQWILLAAVESVQRIDTRIFEERSHAEVCRTLLPEVRTLIMDTVAVFNTVIEHYDCEAEVPGASDSGVFHGLFEELVDAEASDHQQIVDVAFMARWELIRKLDMLVDGELFERWELISACSSAVRRVLKAICGVEQVLAEVERRPSALSNLYQTRVDEALAIRGAYLSLISRLRTIEVQRERLGTTRCVRLVGTAIASLIGHAVYETLRIDDRRTLRLLQQRVLVWLRGEQDQREGEQLLSDVFAIGGLLMEINRRPELIAHDRAAFERVLEQLQRPFGEWLDLQAAFAAVRGRDGDFDLACNAGVDLRQLATAATTVLAQLGPA